ncbi:ankyrin repeat containing protein [Babesia ovata]|uniref:Ankyrin repeat containing protein n=1 Tax=Babesia ovata TaxID=189622 RepID=A0A2H6KE19_9APIC|nr:ankyrin repeat containing protein [Babesia ovata]GBE61236.1 ankyrin repeat containing protein [Babesia ovata]
MANLGVVSVLCLFLAQVVASLTQYEERYGSQLRSLPADEIVEEPLNKFAFGSCQKIELNPKRIYDSITRYNPDMFLYTGDIVYAPNGCCEPHCLKHEYNRLNASSVYREFAASMKRMDGIYDDHDLGINDGHIKYEHREFSQEYLLDFFNKPADHYRRKRAGSYFSMLFRDPEQPKRAVKLIVLDVRYHRDCYYYCSCHTCLWRRMHFNKYFVARTINYLFGFGCNHSGDTLGAEQWRWLEGQLHQSEAEAHIIVSSIQIFTRYPITESWGLLPEAKERLMELLLTTQPKNPIFLSGDVHWGELNEKDGVVEVTSSSLTHSFLEQNKSPYRPFALTLYVFKRTAYMFNNFGGLEFEYDASADALKWSAKLFNTEGQIVRHFSNDPRRDPRSIYHDVKTKRQSFFKKDRMVKCRSILWKLALGYVFLCVLSWMVLTPYIALRAVHRRVFGTRRHKTE